MDVLWAPMRVIITIWHVSALITAGGCEDSAIGNVDYIALSSETRVETASQNGVGAAMKRLRQAKLFRSNPDRKSITLQGFNQAISEIAPFFKHPSFKSESEYRLVVDTLLSSHEVIDYRPSRTSLTPYVQLKIAGPTEPDPVPPDDLAKSLRSRFKMAGLRDSFVARVVVGPTPNKDLSLLAIRSYFRGLGLRVEVEESGVPFRDW